MKNDFDQARLKALIAGVGAIRQHYIEHDRLLEVKEELATLLDRDNRGSEGGCLPLIGQSGSGKTKLITDFVSEHPRRKHVLVTERGEKADHAPVVLVSVPDAGLKPLMERLYTAVSGMPPSDSRRRFDLREETVRLTEEMQTSVVIFEETHQAFGKKAELVEQVSTFFKDLLNDAPFSIVLAGTEEVLRLFKASKELDRRKLDVLTLDPFPWNDPGAAARPEFLDILAEFDDQLAAVLGSRSGLDSPAMALRLHIATGGLIGLLAVLLERAGTFAARELVCGGEPRITVEHLKRAFARRNTEGRPNPFGIAADDAVCAIARRPPAADAAAIPPAGVVRARGRRRRANPDGMFRP